MLTSPLSSQPNPFLLSRQNYQNTPTKTRNYIIASSMDPLTSLGRLLWGPSLPPHLLISTARTTWSATWQLMMRQLAPSSSSSYTRPSSQFPTVPSPYYSHPFNLTLYAALPCPWAHRALILLALKSPPSISLKIVAPSLDGAWEFKEGVRVTKLKEVYGRRKGGYSGRATVPMLWDEEKGDVVCNESYGIVQFLNSAAEFGPSGEKLDLAPEELREEIARWNGIVYPNVNNGVYRKQLITAKRSSFRTSRIIHRELQRISRLVPQPGDWTGEADFPQLSSQSTYSQRQSTGMIKDEIYRGLDSVDWSEDKSTGLRRSKQIRSSKIYLHLNSNLLGSRFYTANQI